MEFSFSKPLRLDGHLPLAAEELKSTGGANRRIKLAVFFVRFTVVCPGWPGIVWIGGFFFWYIGHIYMG